MTELNDIFAAQLLRPATEAWAGGPLRPNGWQRRIRAVSQAKVIDLREALATLEDDVEHAIQTMYDRIAGCARSELLDRHSAEHGIPPSKANTAEFTRMADRWAERGVEAAFAYVTFMSRGLDHHRRWTLAEQLYARLRDEVQAQAAV